MATTTTAQPPGTRPRLRMTYDEYRAWVGTEKRAEWVDGEVIELMTVNGRHALVFGFRFELIRAFVRMRQLGLVLSEPFEMRILNGRSARLPDIFVVLNAHLDRYSDERLEGPADLVIEIVSEGSVTEDRDVKRQEYAVAGIPEYWIVEGRKGRSGFEMLWRTPDGHYAPVLPDEEGRRFSQILPGFWFRDAWLAADPLPDPYRVLRRIAPDAATALFPAVDLSDL
jgi:Uma2 family endonuclease